MRDLSNAPAFVGRGSFFLNMMRPRAGKPHCKLSKGISQATTSSKQKHIGSEATVASERSPFLPVEDMLGIIATTGADTKQFFNLPVGERGEQLEIASLALATAVQQ